MDTPPDRNESHSQETQPRKKGDTWKWWYYVLAGLAAGAGTVYEYFSLTRFEQEGGTRTMNRVIALIYDAVGKWGVVGIGAVVSVLLVAVGLWSLCGKKRST